MISDNPSNSAGAASSAAPRVGVVGASGYTGRELLDLLGTHPDVHLAFATSRSLVGTATGVPGLDFSDPAAVDLEAVDLLFLCLPHGESAAWVARNPDVRARLIDLTADHRPGSGAEDGWVFGLPELFGERIAAAQRVANPGCYPTGVILGLAPLLERDLLDPSRPVFVAAASGVTGAGRTPRTDLLFAEVFGDYRAYAVGNVHRHLREIQATLPGARVIFTPHLLPVRRGILETASLPVREGVSAEDVRQAWRAAYAGSPAVRVRGEGEIPSLAAIVGTDRLDLAVVGNAGEPGTHTFMAALDNLGKGAAGQAVQNMNLMLGLPAERGVRCGRS